MSSLLRELLKKVMYRTNGQDLAEINDIAEDADGATEWDSFVKDCVDIISKVADLFPEPVLEFVYPLFEEDCRAFLGMDRFLQYQSSGLTSFLDIYVRVRTSQHFSFISQHRGKRKAEFSAPRWTFGRN